MLYSVCRKKTWCAIFLFEILDQTWQLTPLYHQIQLSLRLIFTTKKKCKLEQRYFLQGKFWNKQSNSATSTWREMRLWDGSTQFTVNSIMIQSLFPRAQHLFLAERASLAYCDIKQQMNDRVTMLVLGIDHVQLIPRRNQLFLPSLFTLTRIY